MAYKVGAFAVLDIVLERRGLYASLHGTILAGSHVAGKEKKVMSMYRKKGERKRLRFP